jgi:hypothetical protein
MAVGGVVAGALSLIPGGPFVAVGMAYLAHERFSEGRRRGQSRDLLLSLGSLEVALHVADGPDAAKRVAENLSQYTRTAPITRPEVYQDAKRRLVEQSSGDVSSRKDEVERGLKVGDQGVTVVGEALRVGDTTFPIDVVRDYALRGQNLPLPDGQLLQAAMGLLVVAANERAKRGEDLEGLSRRIAAYEEWTGRTAGR